MGVKVTFKPFFHFHLIIFNAGSEQTSFIMLGDALSPLTSGHRGRDGNDDRGPAMGAPNRQTHIARSLEGIINDQNPHPHLLFGNKLAQEISDLERRITMPPVKRKKNANAMSGSLNDVGTLVHQYNGVELPGPFAGDATDDETPISDINVPRPLRFAASRLGHVFNSSHAYTALDQIPGRVQVIMTS